MIFGYADTSPSIVPTLKWTKQVMCPLSFSILSSLLTLDFVTLGPGAFVNLSRLNSPSLR